jgi:hypothetical protein
MKNNNDGLIAVARWLVPDRPYQPAFYAKSNPWRNPEERLIVVMQLLVKNDNAGVPVRVVFGTQ